MEQSEKLLAKKRFMDLSRLAERRESVTFSNFLNRNELSLFHQIVPELETTYQLFGGYEFAERQMIAFIPDALSYTSSAAIPQNGLSEQDVIFPIVCLRFSPAHPKFAEELSHRDILGSLMGLGIERSRIGDIKLNGQEYYIFCEEGISDYILQSLTQIRRTLVTGELALAGSYHIEQKFESIRGVVSSCRLDSIVAFLLKLSRDRSAMLIRSQKVCINDRVIVSNAAPCKEGDIISIRGFGKYIYEGSSGETRKGRMKVTLKKYI